MARIWRKPGVLMIAYLIFFGIAGPWPTGSYPATAAHLAHAVNPAAIVIAAFLAWRVTRGSARPVKPTPVGCREEIMMGPPTPGEGSRGRGDLTRGPLAAAPIGLTGAA